MKVPAFAGVADHVSPFFKEMKEDGVEVIEYVIVDEHAGFELENAWITISKTPSCLADLKTLFEAPTDLVAPIFK